MKPFILFILLAGLAGAAPAHAAAASEFVTGEEWREQMSGREKYLSLIPPTIVFSDYDVRLRLGLPEYIFLIDKIMERNPRLADEEISSIFASTIYFFEPENRAALRRMEMDFLEGDYESGRVERPRLTIGGLLREQAARYS